jgi:hypothetical protein
MVDDVLISFGEQHERAPLLSESLESGPDLECDTYKAKEEPEKTLHKTRYKRILRMMRLS